MFDLYEIQTCDFLGEQIFKLFFHAHLAKPFGVYVYYQLDLAVCVLEMLLMNDVYLIVFTILSQLKVIVLLFVQYFYGITYSDNTTIKITSIYRLN